MDDGGDDDQRPTTGARRRGSATGDWPDGVSYQLMDQILDKLKLLHYETTFCAAKSFPVFDHSIFLVPGRISPFPCFASLVSWALKICKADFLDWEYDDPSTASNNILLEVTKLGFTADFSASKLKAGYGIQVLTLLKFVLDRALQAKGVRLLKPSYDRMSTDIVDGSLDNGSNEIEQEYEIGGGIETDTRNESDIDGNDGDDEVQYETLYGGEAIQSAGAETANTTNGADDSELMGPVILQSSVDPAEWKLELERVAPLLKTKLTGAAKEWRTHLDSMVKHEELLRVLMPDLNSQLGKVGTQMAEITARIQSQENYIQEKFSHLVGEFQAENTAIEGVKNEYSRLSNDVSKLSEILASKTEEFEAMKRQLDTRNDSMTDISPLRRIRVAITDLRNEIRAMELHIGVLRHRMLQGRT